jgi:hypothetical protein
MNPRSRLGRNTSNSPLRSSRRANHFQPRIEPLEDRKMLSATDLLVSGFESTGGQYVTRYNDVTYTPVPGGIFGGAGPNDLLVAQGIATAPDGTFYVSSLFTGKVLHYAADSTFLDVLGAGDAMPAPIYGPGTLEFDHDGALWVGDLGSQGALKFNLANVGQQWDPAGSVFPGYQPTGIGFAPDDGDLILGGFDNKSVIRYDTSNNVNPPQVLIDSSDGNQNPSAILVRPNGDLLIADFDNGQNGGEPLQHHQVLYYTLATDTVTPFMNLTAPFGTGDALGNPAQPTSMIYDHDGNVLVGASPDHNNNGAVLKFNINTGLQMGGPLLSGLGLPTGLAFVESQVSVVAGRHLFYNQSGTGGATVRYDGNDAAINSLDDNAIATDKVAYLPEDAGPATFANVSSYTKGINGIMLDLAGAHGSISAADFEFRAGNNNSPSAWGTAAAPASISVRAGAGVGGSDRVEITWANGAIQKQWLEVIVLANANTGLTQKAGYPVGQGDVFFFGNAVGNSGLGDTAINATVNATDENGARNNPANLAANIPVTNIYDYDRNAQVNANDQNAARLNATNSATVVKYINLSSPPLAPQSDDGDEGAIATAFTATSPAGDDATSAPTSATLGITDLNSTPAEPAVARQLLYWARANTPRARAILATADSMFGSEDLDEELFAALAGRWKSGQ